MSAPVIGLGVLNRYKRIFRKAGATNPAAAIIPSQHGIPNSLLFRRLVRQGVVVHVGDGIYYLDEDRETQVTNNRRRVVITLAAIIIEVLIICFFAKAE